MREFDKRDRYAWARLSRDGHIHEFIIDKSNGHGVFRNPVDLKSIDTIIPQNIDSTVAEADEVGRSYLMITWSIGIRLFVIVKPIPDQEDMFSMELYRIGGKVGLPVESITGSGITIEEYETVLKSWGRYNDFTGWPYPFIEAAAEVNAGRTFYIDG